GLGPPRAGTAARGAVPVLCELRVRRAPELEGAAPLPLELLALVAEAHVIVDAVRNHELGIRIPAHDLLGRAHLFLAERRAVRLGRGGGVGRRVGDVAANADEGGTAGFVARRGEGRTGRVEVVRVSDVLAIIYLCIDALVYAIV